jgi:predicted HAD superfamily Cof-like phosphohydrolase
MNACGQENTNNIYEVNNPQNTRLYLRLITEEYFELLRSFSDEKEHKFLKSIEEMLYEICENGNKVVSSFDRVSIADDLADLNYVIHGLSNVLGINLELVKAEVHSSNMSKLNPITGLADRDENNKVIKGANYFKPNILKVLEHASFI